jgi:hypothetical protein
MKFYKRLLILSILTICAISGFAQKNKSSITNFYSVNNIGLLEGQNGSAFQLQTINGIKYKSWFAGIGIGLDFYRIRSIPLFADVRKEFGKTANKLFVFADAGINFGWRTDKETKQFYTNDKLKNGFYAETGAGYKFRLSKANNMSFSLAYSYKTNTETGIGNYFVPNPYNFPGTGALPPDQEKISYHLNRIVIKVGFDF